MHKANFPFHSYNITWGAYYRAYYHALTRSSNARYIWKFQIWRLPYGELPFRSAGLIAISSGFWNWNLVNVFLHWFVHVLENVKIHIGSWNEPQCHLVLLAMQLKEIYEKTSSFVPFPVLYHSLNLQIHFGHFVLRKHHGLHLMKHIISTFWTNSSSLLPFSRYFHYAYHSNQWIM